MIKILKLLFDLYRSPFVFPKIKFYFGRLAYGTPYFYPRRWVKSKEKKGWLTPVPKKIGFDFVQLGWKIKWTPTDYRFEWAPLISFVFFKWQVCVFVEAPHRDHYWEAWLYYSRNTKGTNEERIEQCRRGFPVTWNVHDKAGKRTVDYYDFILK